MSKRLVLLNKDTLTLARKSNYIIPLPYLIGIISQLHAECKMRGIEFISEDGDGYDPFGFDMSDKDTVFLALSPYESTQKVSFIRAREHKGNCGYAVMMSGFLNQCHASYMAMWIYASAYQKLIFNTPVDLMSLYSNSRPLGLDALDEDNTLIISGFPFPVITGKTNYNSEASTRIKIGFLVEPSTPTGLNFLVALSKLQEHNDITLFYLNSPMRPYSNSVAEYEGKTMELLNSVAPTGKMEDIKDMNMLVQTLPYSPRQLYHCAKGVEHGCLPILFDPASEYDANGILQTYASPIKLEEAIDEASKLIERGGEWLGYAAMFFNSYIPSLLDNLGLVKDEKSRIKQ